MFKELPRLIFIFCLTLATLGSVYLFGAYSYRSSLPPIPQLKTAYRTLFSEDGLSRSPLTEHLQPSRGQGAGVTINKAPDVDALIGLVGFFDDENQIRLIRRDGTVVTKWSLDYLEHFPDQNVPRCQFLDPLDVDIHGFHITPRGEVVFNYEYCGTAKLDYCGKLAWTIAKPTHHSVVPAEAGGYWLLGRHFWTGQDEPDRFPPFSGLAGARDILEDTLLRIGDDGEIIEEISIPEKMVESGMEAVLTANGLNFAKGSIHREELVHANKVTELSS